MKNKLMSVLFALVLAASAVIPVSAASSGSCKNSTQSSSPSFCLTTKCSSGNTASSDCKTLQECLNRLVNGSSSGSGNCPSSGSYLSNLGSCFNLPGFSFDFGNGSDSGSPETPSVPDPEPEQPETPVETPDPEPEQPETPVETPDPEPEQPGNSGGNSSNGTIQSVEQEVVDLVNEQRAANGLSPLTISAELCDGARMKSQDMHDVGYFSHTSPTYGSPFDMMASLGITYSAAGENIAMGYSSAEAVMNAWMNSEGHRANILSSKYTSIGVGYVADGNYWTQWFIG